MAEIDLSNPNLAASPEGIQAIPTLADSMKQSLAAIDAAMSEMESKIGSYDETSLGVHYEAFMNAFNKIKSAVESAKEPVAALPPRLEESAEKIRAFIGATDIAVPTSGGN